MGSLATASISRLVRCILQKVNMETFQDKVLSQSAPAAVPLPVGHAVSGPPGMRN